MTYVVELTYPHLPDDRFDERHECASAGEAGEWAESLCPLDGEEVAELLLAGERVKWEGDEGQPHVVTAERSPA